MPAFPMDDFFEKLCTRVFRVEVSWQGVEGVGGRSATAFAIDKRPTGQLILATAKHVLDVPLEATVHWRIQQFDDYNRLQRETSFQTNQSKTPDVPYRFHKKHDVGFLALPSSLKQPNGESFHHPDEKPLSMIAENCMQGISTRVGWAGFPGQIKGFIKHPALCYCEGVISCMIKS